ncbi:hypothetical protein GM3708_837 [Geminocystis sp. NIES-3708]|uniref:DUF423 domain-containing protein n=1 Tax=Geminocystis sp. NIES-3708 TaxID=1615909 RepID=UPI0005FCB32D|nr:DUF423 domain-containing protein [Geminocystis sp. NIES-3708]BAQ60431.1 hypothetical protein GM3708_837 [Geminocystis sp. NIES-3708]
MNNLFLAIASILAGLAVIGGAFASHSLKNILTDYALSIWETGIKYQMYHSLGLFLVAILMKSQEISSIWLNTAGFAFIIGIILFSGSLYLLSFTEIKWLGAITPLGGVAFILGWGCLAFFAFSFNEK